MAHGGGYHTSTAGLPRIDGFVNQPALAGKPVGQAAAGRNGAASNYAEMRRSGEPTNLLP